MKISELHKMGIDFFKRDLSPDVVSFNFDLNKNVEISSQDFIYTKHGYKFWIDKTFVYKRKVDNLDITRYSNYYFSDSYKLLNLII